MAPWSPQPEGLQEILQTILESTATSATVQRNITEVRSFHSDFRWRMLTRYQKLNQFTRAPEYVAYLAYILSQMPQEEDRIRTIAGYLLKNNARLILQATPDVVEFVKSAVLSAFNDSSIMIRNAASQDIVAFLGVLEPRNWPECLQHLVMTLDSSDLDRQEVSFLRFMFSTFSPALGFLQLLFTVYCTRAVILTRCLFFYSLHRY
jgi:transportin-1